MFLIALFAATPELADTGPGDRAASPGTEVTETQFLPVGDLFDPLVADFKFPRFAVSYRQYHYQGDRVYIAAAGVGELFGLYRSVDRNSGAGWQISFAGGLLAQFNHDASPCIDYDLPHTVTACLMLYFSHET